MSDRYYLDELKSKNDENFEYDDGDERRAKWAEERAKFGFDGRDTWALNMTMTEMLYERLSMYLEKADPIVDLTHYKYDYKGTVYNQREFILMMIEDAKTYLTFEYDNIPEINAFDDDSDVEKTQEEFDEHLELFGEYELKADEAKKRLWEVWAIIQPHMWW